jgi:type I restriction enzyme S subunit
MSQWKRISLGDAATFHNGYAFKPSDWSKTGKEIIRIQNLTKGSAQINYFEGELPDKYKVRQGDIIISWSGSLGVYEWNNEEAWLNQHLFKVVFDKEELNKSFFKHLISVVLKEMEGLVHGATMKHITKQKFDAFQIPLPPLPQQKKIAAILDAADAYRQKTKALITKYDELTQSLFLDMFGDPVKNEKGWEMLSGRIVFKLIGGAAFKSLDYTSQGIPLIRIGTVNKGYFDNTQLTFIPSSFEKSHSKYLVYPNDLLITLTGTVGKDDYGNAFVLTNEFEKYLLNQRVAKICNSEKHHLVFLNFFLKQNKVKNELIGVSRGVRQANLSNEDFYKLETITPPRTLQNQFAERVQAIEEQKAQAQASLEKAEELFNSLLQRAFNGKLL